MTYLPVSSQSDLGSRIIQVIRSGFKYQGFDRDNIFSAKVHNLISGLSRQILTIFNIQKISRNLKLRSQKVTPMTVECEVEGKYHRSLPYSIAVSKTNRTHTNFYKNEQSIQHNYLQSFIT